MLYTLDTFIPKLMRWPAFKIDSPTLTSFMLSYDMDTDVKQRNYQGDFRDFVIAALLSKEVIKIESYVGSTIIFTVESDEDNQLALILWRDFLINVFSTNFRIHLAVLSESLIASPFHIHHNTTDLADRFIDRVNAIKSKF